MSSPRDDTVLFEMMTTLRASLHQCPEASGAESFTSGLVADFLARYHPDQLLTHVGGTGIAAVFDGNEHGPTVLIRAELDAVAAEPHDATLMPTVLTHGFAHRCGHDGHMTMVAGIAPLLAARRPERGSVVLLFQPAEETGAGAAAMLQDPRLSGLHPTCALALHNLPGFPLGSVVLRGGIMTSASVGMRASLFGEASHAAEPEKGHPPAGALSRLLVDLPELNRMHEDPYRMVTITHARMGRATFGVSPGHAELFATLRATTTEALIELQGLAANAVNDHAQREHLVAEVEWLEAFPEIRNDEVLTMLIEELAGERGLPVIRRDMPFRWSDDFGHFSRAWPSVYFGLGIGEEAAGLHNAEYRFPDDVMRTGLDLLYSTAMRVLEDAEQRPQVALASA